MNCTMQNHDLERVYFRSCLESSPRPAGSSRRPMPNHANIPKQSQLHQLKQKMLELALEQISETGLFKRICGAANQAAEQAWNTSCPLLVFPCLFQDLVQKACDQFQMAHYGSALESFEYERASSSAAWVNV